MKKQINPTIKAHLIRSAFYVLLLLAVCVIPFTLAQRNVAKQSAGQPTRLAPSAAASALTSKSTVPDSSVKAADAASSALAPGTRSIQIQKSPRHITGNLLWYNGDFNGVNGLANEDNTGLGDGEFASVYDDFNVPSGGWTLTSVFSDNLSNTNITGALWEIRQGISEGNGGTLIASGMTMTPVVTDTGRGGFGFQEFMVEVTGLNVSLVPGTYWLNVTPIGDLSGRSFDSTTSGANCVGTPCGNNMNAFFNSNFFGANFTSQATDFSMGVAGTIGGGGTPTPTPTGTPTCTPGALWYNGDFNGVNGLANEDNTSLGDGEFASVYDDFIVPSGPGWHVTSVFSDNLSSTNVTGATWEIRQGISEGNGGTVIASGMTMTPVVTPTGRSGFNFIEYMVEVTGLNVSLSPGTYWLNVTPIGDLSGRSFDSTTSGANCVGTPCGNNQNAFFNSNFFGANFTSTANEGQPTDFSMGVVGTISGGCVPTPTPTATPTATPTGTPTCTPGALWYNGDFNHVNELANEDNTTLGSGEFASVYDDFIVPSPGWHVTSVFSDNLEDTTVTGATWEIRQGISEGNGGTLIASGMTTTPVVTPTGRSGMGFTEFMIEVTGLNVSLAPGTYWLNVTPIGNLTGRSFDSNTSGANCVGTPCGNDQNAFFNSNFFKANFTSTSNFGQPTDFSMGVNGTAGCGTPSPTPTATATATNTPTPTATATATFTPTPTPTPTAGRISPTPRPRPTPPPRP
jgi:hypothetical protein